MADQDDVELRALAARAARAAPATSSGRHVSELELARMHRGDEDSSLDDAYRHVASCAVCRARLTDAAAGRALVAAVMPKAKPKSRPLGYLLAAAAAFALVVIVLMRRSPDARPLTVTQRSFVGTMGSAPAPSISIDPKDRNVELTVEDDAEAARAIVCDAEGRRISGDQVFTRGTGGKLALVLAPRTFAPHVGDARVWVFAGKAAALNEVVPSSSTGPNLVESTTRKQAEEKGIRFAIVVLSE